MENEINNLNLDSYILKLLKQIHPTGVQLSKDGKKYLNELVVNVLSRMCLFIVAMTEHSRAKTISSRDVQTATRLFFKDELVKHAVSSGVKAVTRFTTFVPNKKRTSSSEKSNLVLPPSRFRNYLEHCTPNYKIGVRISPNAVIYLTAVIEYFLAEILEISGNNNKKITEESIKKTIENDTELKKTICHI